jgi:hypothetical protein
MVPADSSICFGCRPPSQAAHAAQSFSEHSPLEVWGRKRGAGREKDGCLLFVIGGSSTDGTLGCGRKEDKHLSSRLPEISPIPEVVKDEKDVLASMAKGAGMESQVKGFIEFIEVQLTLADEEEKRKGSPHGPDLMRAHHPRAVHIRIGLLGGRCGMLLGSGGGVGERVAEVEGGEAE